jgi:acetoin utilization deacetylase AcuC-like enzyme
MNDRSQQNPAKKMKPTGIVKDPCYLLHDMGSHHPESPERLAVIYQMIEEINRTLHLVEIPSRDATYDEIAAVHDRRYVDQIAATAGRDETFLDPDTSACAHSWNAAIRAAGGLLSLIDAVTAGAIRNGFALVRPPGHHAERRRAMGFCFFNNIAVAARYAINAHGLERVAIVDWDLHHGNGTQNSFYEDSRVMYVSTHQYPHYPGTGGTREVGHGPGVGFTINFPMSPGFGDAEYVAAFDMVIAPILAAYNPQLILVSAGFDAHHLDPLGGMSLTEDGFEQILQILMHLAAELCSDRIILALEGGYSLQALPDSVKRMLTCLAQYDPETATVPMPPPLEALSRTFKSRLFDVMNTQRQHWPNLPLL